MIDTGEQQAIINAVTTTSDSLVVEALAGTGKTTTLLRALARIPQKSILLCAFNRRIADELEAKKPIMPPGSLLHVKTFHAQGLAMVRAHYPRIEVSHTGTEDVIKRVAGGTPSFNVKRAAVRLLRQIKEVMVTDLPPTSQEALALGYEYDLFDRKMNERQIGLAVELARDGYTISLDLANRQTIDYCDMVWAPLACKLEPKSRYQAVLVDELQDISPPQFAMLRKLMAPKARFIGIGDINQQIYGWRGSMGEAAWALAREELKAKFLPLTMTWRCATAIVNAAKEIVPTLRGRDGADPGVVAECAWAKLPKAITEQAASTRPYQAHTFVLSRTNADLLDCALYLWRSKVSFELNAGKEMLDPLFHLLDYDLDLRSREAFIRSLEEWHAKMTQAAEKANSPSAADRADEQRNMLLVAVQNVEPLGIKRLLSEIIMQNDSGVLLSTVHKVKGLEADRVFLLRQTFARHTPCHRCGGSGDGEGEDGMSNCIACGGDGRTDPDQEELNIEYVAITRARTSLVWVDMNVRTIGVNDFTTPASASDLCPEPGDFDDAADPDVMKDMIDLAADIELDRLVRPNEAASRDALGIQTEAEQLLERSREFLPTLRAPKGDHAQDTKRTNMRRKDRW